MFVDQDEGVMTLIDGGGRYARKEQKGMKSCCRLIVNTMNTMSGGCRGCGSINIDGGGQINRYVSSFCSKSAPGVCVACVNRSYKIKRATRVTTIIFMPDVPYTVAKACPQTLYQYE